MHTSQRKQIFKPGRGLLYVSVRSAGFPAGQLPPPIEKIYQWNPDAKPADWWAAGAVERFLADPACPIPTDGLRAVPAPICSCCGFQEDGWGGLTLVKPHPDPALRQYRCWRHLDRNPCAIAGCSRTAPAGGYFSNDVVLCGTHWRMAAPPGSPQRKIYNRLWRLRKKRGEWTPDLDARYWRIWPRIVERGRSLAAGDLDMAEINKMFGWDDAGLA